MARDPEAQRRAARRHYEANTATVKARSAEHRRQQRRRLAEYVRTAKDCPCTDCGRRYPPYVMQFDHVRGEKEGDIARLVATAVSLVRLQREIAKCEVVCANCHAERTYQRGEHLPLALRSEGRRSSSVGRAAAS